MMKLDPRLIEAAAGVIAPVFLDSPLLAETSLDGALDVHVSLKVETLNPIRSFKGRGASAFVSAMEAARPLVCASAGNFGQGLAYAARRRGIPVTVFAAVNANPMKLEAMRRFGADVRLAGEDFDAAKSHAREYAAATGVRFVEDGAEPEIAHGAGTIALELPRAFDAVVIPLGNGALATGMGAWIKHRWPATRVIAVVAAGAPSMKLSFDAGAPVATARAETIADGIAVREPVAFAVACLAATVDEVIEVSEDSIGVAMRLAHDHLGLVVEPAGVAGLAAIVAERQRFHALQVATVLCGGNVTAASAQAEPTALS